MEHLILEEFRKICRKIGSLFIIGRITYDDYLTQTWAVGQKANELWAAVEEMKHK